MHGIIFTPGDLVTCLRFQRYLRPALTTIVDQLDRCARRRGAVDARAADAATGTGRIPEDDLVGG